MPSRIIPMRGSRTAQMIDNADEHYGCNECSGKPDLLIRIGKGTSAVLLCAECIGWLRDRLVNCC